MGRCDAGGFGGHTPLCRIARGTRHDRNLSPRKGSRSICPHDERQRRVSRCADDVNEQLKETNEPLSFKRRALKPMQWWLSVWSPLTCADTKSRENRPFSS